MRAIFHRQREWGPKVTAVLAVLVSLVVLSGLASAQVCAITGDLKLCGDSSGEICGPPGMASYSWVGPGGITATTQCISVSVVGRYELTITDSQQNTFTCAGNVSRVPLPTCTITPTNGTSLCATGTVELCGPADMSEYKWTGPGGFDASTRCITVSEPGTYVLTIADVDGCESTCEETVTDEGGTCAITGRLKVCAGETTELCGPEGADSYAWSGPGGFVAGTRCVNVGVAGPYTLTVTANGCTRVCQANVVTVGDDPCSISGDREFCEGGTTTLCGPEGAISYAWTGPGGYTASTRCITVGVEGTYELTVVDGEECTSTCTATIADRVCEGENCPRTPGFWTQQCEQREGGSTKFDREQMDRITACVDAGSDFFDWPSDFDGFCAVVDPPRSMDIREQTLRHYAVLLANACTGDLGIIANNGDAVSLSLDTEIDCDGLDDVDTIGELINEAEDRLADLEGDPLNDEVRSAYGELKDCMDAINNGVGIGPTCKDDDDEEDEEEEEGAPDPRGSERGGKGSLKLRVSPNPFNGSVTIGYAVPAQGDAMVSVAIYDVAGRMVRQLVSGTFAPGPYSAHWNGRDESGRTAASGVYYARARVGDLEAVTRVLLVQ